MVMEIVHEDMGDESMQCMNHPQKNSTPGGICASCLQEKLGRLTSFSFPAPTFPSSSPPSSSPSRRSDFASSCTTVATATATSGGFGGAALQLHQLTSSAADSQNGENDCGFKRSKLPFVSKNKKKKNDGASIVFERSKSTAIPSQRGMHFLDENYTTDRRGFWSFLYSSKQSNSKKNENKHYTDSNLTPANNVGSSFVVVDENRSSPNETAARERKVSRSKSVGRGSRSFSGVFFEKISTGFGDCTLRRVESQREGKPKVQVRSNGHQDCIKERVKCGGIFSGLMVASSSSSSSSSSSNWVSNSNSTENHNVRTKSWGWVLASPLSAFSSKPSARKRDATPKTPNLSAIPSLLAESG